jgi:cytochrome P450
MPRFPPGPGRIAAFRALVAGGDFARVPRFFAAVAARYGGMASWPQGASRFYLVTDPAAIEELLVTEARAFVKGRGTQRLERLLGHGLLTNNGPDHLRRRRLVQPAFHRERIAGYAAAMVERTERFVDGLELERPLEIDRALRRLTLGIAAETLFGAQLDEQAGAIGRALDGTMASFRLSVMPLGEIIDFLPMLPVVRRFRAARDRLDRIMYGLIAERRATGEDRGDALSMLLASRDGTAALDDEQVRDEALTLLLAGHETTANALSWSCWLLATHPTVQDRLRAELAAVLGDRPPSFADLPRLVYTRAVVSEAMRLYPPAWVVGRRAIAPVTIADWTIPRGGLVVASQYVVHRDPRWWPEPTEFRPERWLDPAIEALPKFAYFPFGGGNRLCIGEAFAWTETVAVLATMVRRIAFTPAEDGEPGIRPSVTLRPARPIALVPGLAGSP